MHQYDIKICHYNMAVFAYWSLCTSYSTVVLYIGIMKVWGFWPKIITPKPA